MAQFDMGQVDLRQVGLGLVQAAGSGQAGLVRIFGFGLVLLVRWGQVRLVRSESIVVVDHVGQVRSGRKRLICLKYNMSLQDSTGVLDSSSSSSSCSSSFSSSSTSFSSSSSLDTWLG